MGSSSPAHLQGVSLPLPSSSTTHADARPRRHRHLHDDHHADGSDQSVHSNHSHHGADVHGPHACGFHDDDAAVNVEQVRVESTYPALSSL